MHQARFWKRTKITSQISIQKLALKWDSLIVITFSYDYQRMFEFATYMYYKG